MLQPFFKWERSGHFHDVVNQIQPLDKKAYPGVSKTFYFFNFNLNLDLRNWNVSKICKDASAFLKEEGK